jgi:DNA-binding MarR family transcriptional regulator
LNINTAIDHEMAILDYINRADVHSNRAVRQRDLARLAGISLGMTNSILKRLAQKGWVTIRRINSRNIHYALSAAGMEVIARRSYRFLRRTLRHIAVYKETIHSRVREAAHRGCRTVVLVGRSDIDFIIEHCAAAEGMTFVRDSGWDGSATIAFFSENLDPPEVTERASSLVSLKNLHIRDGLG